MTTPPPPDGIYLQDLYDPRRRIGRAYFPAFALLLGVMPAVLWFGVPVVLTVLSARRRYGDGLLFGREPLEYAPAIYSYVFAMFAYVVVVVCINRMRATGHSLGWLLVPGYNLYLLLRAPDQER